MRVIFRWRARTLAAAVLVSVGMLAAGTVVLTHSAHRAALSGAALPVPGAATGSNAAMTHSPQMLKKLAGATAPYSRPAARGTATPGTATASTTTAPGPEGIDVSSHQHDNGSIDWGQVAAAGYKFAAVKATEGDDTLYTNPYFASDIAAANTAGLYVMAYTFAIPNSSLTATQQADDLVSVAKGSANGATPQLELDIEYNPYSGGECYGLTAAQMVSWIGAFRTEIWNKTRQLPVIYTSADWWTTCTADSTAFSVYPLWIASYGTPAGPTMPAAWQTWTFWQYTSTGSVPGISGNVDVSYFNNSAGALASPGNQAGAVGAPVWRQIYGLVGTTGFSATGLPPGLSISTATGLISGWLTTPGTYPVTVTATTPFGTTGTTGSFSWAVSAAPNSGPAGPVVLYHGGKCMDDPGYVTTNGTRVDIWSCTGGGNEHWTMAQDSTIRVYGKCLDAYQGGITNGTPVDLYTCNGTSAQQWRISQYGDLVNMKSGKCLDDPAYLTANGTRLDIYTCGTGTNLRWTTPAGPIVSQVAPMCADDASGSTADGTLIYVRPCSGGSSQAWTVKPDGSVRLYGKCLDVYQGGTASGTRVDLYSCNGTGAQQWRPRADGTLLNPQSGLCLDDPGNSSASSTRLVVANCGTYPGEDWHIR